MRQEISIHTARSCLCVFGVFLFWAQVTRKAQVIPPRIYNYLGHSLPALGVPAPFISQSLFAFFRDAPHQPCIQLFFLGPWSDMTSNPSIDIVTTSFSVLPPGPPLPSPPFLDPPLYIRVLSTLHHSWIYCIKTLETEITVIEVFTARVPHELHHIIFPQPHSPCNATQPLASSRPTLWLFHQPPESSH